MELTSAFVSNPAQHSAKVHVVFDMHERHDPEASKEAGRPIYRMVEYIQIFTPGDPSNAPHRPVTTQDRELYPEQYARFKQGLDQGVGAGTPLSKVPWLDRAQVAELKHFKVATVEHLATMQDQHVAKFPGGHKLKAQAQAYLAAAAGEAPMLKLQAALEESKAEVALLRKQLEDAVAQLKQAAQAKAK